eukprot:6980092-Prymnesium_polylepis.1
MAIAIELLSCNANKAYYTERRKMSDISPLCSQTTVLLGSNASNGNRENAHMQCIASKFESDAAQSPRTLPMLRQHPTPRSTSDSEMLCVLR